MRRRQLAVAAVLAVALAGCARITVVSGPQPSASNRDVVDVPMSQSYLLGIVPPPEVNVRDACPRGAARVQTEHSPGNVLLSVLTFGIYTPMQVTVVCAPR